MKAFYVVLLAVGLAFGVTMAAENNADNIKLLKRLLEAVREVDKEKREMSNMMYDGKEVTIHPRICVVGDAAKQLCRHPDEHKISIREADTFDLVKGMTFNVKYTDTKDGRYVAPALEPISARNLKRGERYIAMACEYYRATGVENQCNAFEFTAGTPCKTTSYGNDACKKVKVCYGSRGPRPCSGTGGGNSI